MMMKMKQSIKRMVLTGAAVTVMMSLAAPVAMAQTVVRDHRDGSEEAGPIIRDHRDDSTSTVEEEPYKDSGIRQCDITPVECEGTDESRDSVVVRDHRDGGSKDEEAASAPGGVKVGVNNPSATTPKEAVGAPADEAGQTANSPTVRGCASVDDVYDEEFDMCLPSTESLEFFSVLVGDEPWPDSVGGYVNLLGSYNDDTMLSLGLMVQLGGKALEDALVELAKDGGPIGWRIQGVGYTAGFVGEVGGVLLQEVSQVTDAVHDSLGEAVDAIGAAAEDAWDTVSGWF
jgi:hypothetical protein